MPTCIVCHRIYYTQCDQCRAMYEQDLRERLIPPQFTEAEEKMSFYDWTNIRVAERYDPLLPRATPEEKEEIRREYVNEALNECIRAHKRQRAAESKPQVPTGTTQEAEIRSRYTY